MIHKTSQIPLRDPAAYYPRELMARIVFTWLFIVMVYLFANNALLSQLEGWKGARYPWMRLGFDVLLTCSCIICAIIPAQRFFTWICIACVAVLIAVHYSNAGSEYAHPAYLLVLIPFMQLKEASFARAWNFYRYMICVLYLVFAVVFCCFGIQEQANALQSFAGWFVFNQASPGALLTKPAGIFSWVYGSAVLIGLLMVIGLFSRRFDHWLMAGLLISLLGNLFFLHRGFVEQSLIFAAFLPWQRWAERLQINRTND